MADVGIRRLTSFACVLPAEPASPCESVLRVSIAREDDPEMTGGGRTTVRRPWMFPVAALGLVFLSLWFRPDATRSLAGINDFMGIYAGARLVGTPEQFSTGAYIREQVRATGWSAPSILYTRLPAFAFLLRPLGRLDYRAAYFVWQGLSLASFLTFLMLWPTRDRGLLLCAACCSFPLFADVTGGQDIAFLLLIVAIAWRLAPSRPFAAGAVLALSALKFHLFFLLPLFLIAQRRWRVLAGVGATTAGILATCFVAAGPGWIPDYVRFVLQEQTNPSVRNMVNLRGLFEGLPHSLAWEAASAALVAIGVAWIARRVTFSVGLSAALAGSLLTSHHAYGADALLLLPALLTLAADVPVIPLRVLCFLLLSSLPFLISPQVPLSAPVPLLLAALLTALIVSLARFKPGSPHELSETPC